MSVIVIVWASVSVYLTLHCGRLLLQLADDLRKEEGENEKEILLRERKSRCSR